MWVMPRTWPSIRFKRLSSFGLVSCFTGPSDISSHHIPPGGNMARYSGGVSKVPVDRRQCLCPCRRAHWGEGGQNCVRDVEERIHGRRSPGDGPRLRDASSDGKRAYRGTRGKGILL